MKELKSRLEQIIAKLQRKKNKIQGQIEEVFKYNAEGKDPDSFINMLKDVPEDEAISKITQYAELWKFLDEFKPSSFGSICF